jgi:L-ribulose-5-phosphate 3-epimerase
MLKRREFLISSSICGAGLLASACGSTGTKSGSKVTMPSHEPMLKISLAQWSLHGALGRGEMTNLDFPRVSREKYGIDAIEYVNSFMRKESLQAGYIQELKKTCEGEGVQSLLIMCDGEGNLGDPDAGRRTAAIANHHRWIDIAKELGCHSIRVNARSAGDWATQRELAADGLARLTEYGAPMEINVIVENHGGLSSNGKWLAEVMELVGHPRCGTLPDFGNFYIGDEAGPKGDGWYDIYQGIEELMPYAKAVSAKSHNFDADGNEDAKDYMRILRIVLDAGYRGHLGIEYEGGEVSEPEGIALTKALLERCIASLTPEYT